ncbi:pyrophosphatase PpaX [Bacillus sp. DTU_2020_1000418_1_SI_GHA_SEK_038]|uniref:pyrophosphatase PpaX n=1 Tax=Bacillus sp. DTU_2020_1000418_1_SI_GHA_SEK_038 TaxID=3077585 RepID=UPI0028ED5905|nr:pyrophosphatase PpaX [Bacillus sp. DTU_2020_1000418_1_SI_GHA_SEK_038]WNS75043.1 pyrophosphatase PpaX [Bacillus sp. DTU_2020_1000418_1_SI_GHA_SEK_038]
MSTQVNTILFDLDGTLIDTNELIITSFLHVLGSYYPDRYTREDVLPFMGPTLRETFESINPEKVEEMIEAYKEFNITNHDLHVKEFPGVFETIRTLKESGYKIGIVTTKGMITVKMGLALTKLDQFFDVVVALDHVQNPKPDPEPILKALEQLQAKPEEAMMVGDNSHDILGGKNAGTQTVAVAWSLKGKQFLEGFDPDYIIDHMADLLDILKADKG